MTDLVFWTVACLLVWLQAMQLVPSMDSKMFQRPVYGLDPSMSNYIVSNTSLNTIIACAMHCFITGCKSYVYDAGGYCVLYEAFLRSIDNNLDGLYIAEPELCHPRALNTQIPNVALGKPVSMSSSFDYYTPGTLLVNGDTSGIWPCASTLPSANPYMILDLEQNYNVMAFYVLNRSCCTTRLHHLKIQIGDNLANLTNVVYHEEAIGVECTFIFTVPIYGRYVKLLIDAVEFLTVCEFEVYSMD